MSLTALYRSRYRTVANQAGQQMAGNRLKVLIIAFAALGLWLSLFRFFYGGFIFLDGFPDLKDWVVAYIFAIFFFSLGLMLVISNAIISYSSFYYSAESAALISMPITAGRLFLYKLTESLAFSSWAFFFLGTPFLVAYGINTKTNPYFYGWLVLLILVFIILPAVGGGVLTLLIGRFLPRSKRAIILTLALITLAAIMVMISNLASLRGMAVPFTERWMQAFMYKLAFAQNPLLPSYWMTRSIVSAGQANYSESGFFLLMLLANGLFIGLMGYYLAGLVYFKAYSMVHSSRHDRKYPARGLLDYLGSVLLFLFGKPLRLIMVKDLKAFVRDPVQWTQFLVFFGILGVYFLNLRNVPYINIKEPFWQYLISFLNLTATVLTLATFTTRFIYPQLSLEGKRFWVIGMMPISREKIFYGKFIFAVLGTIIVSEPLIFISSWMLEIPSHLLFYQLYVTLI
ncbi:MAG: hypothetical protein HY762_00670, partial [Planctomycetes bacterium]|nr:hypothetical protein [Planctomycetota bacterium]